MIFALTLATGLSLSLGHIEVAPKAPCYTDQYSTSMPDRPGCVDGQFVHGPPGQRWIWFNHQWMSLE